MSDRAEILVVDDSRETVLVAEKILAAEGYAIRTAASGEEALEEIGRSVPALVLLDVFLPGISGIDVCRAMGERVETRRVPIILMSAYADSERWIEGLEQGAADYVKKPFEPIELVTRVRTHLALKRADASLAEQADALRQNLERAERSRRALLSAIEDQKRTQRALAESEERYRLIVTTGRDMTMLQKPSGEITYVSPQIREILGVSPEEMPAKRHEEFIHSEDLVSARENMSRAKRGEAITDFEYRIVRPDGAVRWLSHTVRPLVVEGELKAFVSTIRDVTERMLSEAALRAHEQRFRRIFESSAFGIAITSLEKGWVEVNDRVCEMFGYSREELVRLNWADLTFPADLDADTAQFERVLCGQSDGYELDKRFIRKDGTVFHVRLTVRCVRRADGTVEYFVPILQDISAHVMAEETRKNLEAQLIQAQKMESVGRLAGGVAHDFNNLLSVILGYAEMLLGDRDGAPEDDPQRMALLEIFTAGERAKGLTQQLLAFSRKQVLEMSRLDLNAVLADFKRMLARLIGEDIALVTSLAKEPVEIDADKSQIEQIVLNLAVNARDAMPRGGRLLLSCANVEVAGDTRGGPEGAPPGGYAELKVRDTGSGMSGDVLRQIFEPFFTTKGPGSGTGLGLATVYGIVKQHGGYIDVESFPGEGATFRILLPRAAAQPRPSQRPSRADGARSTLSGHERILVVEDDLGVRKLTVHLLSSYGYDVLEAASLEEAIPLSVDYAPIDLLLTDVVMPRFSGADVYEAIEKRQPGLKVLFMSGYVDDVIAERGVLAPGTRLLRKPFSNDELARKVREALSNG